MFREDNTWHRASFIVSTWSFATWEESNGFIYPGREDGSRTLQ